MLLECTYKIHCTISIFTNWHKNPFAGLFGTTEIVSSPIVRPKHEQQQEDIRSPSRPGDPGYVQYTAQHWGETTPKTPRHSPTEV